MKRTALWIRLVAVLTCLLMVASCGGDPTGTTATTPTTGTTGTETPAQKDLTILSDGATDYKIIYAASGDSWEKGFATRLQNTVFAVTGVKIPVEADNKSAVDAGAKEIILATPKNNRAATYSELGELTHAERDFLGAIAVLKTVGHHAGEIAVSLVQLAHLTYERDDTATEQVEKLLDEAWEYIKSPDQERNGNYAYVLRKCAPSYDYFKRPDEAQALRDVANEIYYGKD